jgi:hypothetical protein
MQRDRRVSRRTVLKGLGTALALPALEAMLPVGSLAARVPQKSPVRMAFMYVPNGVHMADWTPTTTGDQFALPWILEPLEPFRKEILVLSNLALDKARPHGDGPGDHARAMASFLTGCQARKTHGADIHLGISVDQVAAERLGKATRFPSLELGCEGGLQSGNCDSGYSCAYSANLSWRSATTPMPKEIDPRLVFERLFGNQVPGEMEVSRGRRDLYRQSILDLVAEDARQLRSRLGATDRRKLDEYLTAVREVEGRITRHHQPAKAPAGQPACPPGIPKQYDDHLRVMGDLLALAFQGDLTRVATFVFANDGSNRSYRVIGVPEGHHDLSHHGRDKKKQERIRQINRFHISQVAYLLGKLKGIKEGDGTLLDHSMLVYGSGISDGDRHNHDDLPILLAGQGGGSIRTGRHIRYAKDTPLMNLYLAMLERFGAPVPSLGDSTGRLPELSK